MVEDTGMQAGGAATPSAETSKTEPQTQPTPLTTEQMEAVQKIVAEQAARIAQSMVDKAENRISKKAQEQIDALKLTQSALGLTDEQVDDAANKIVLNDLKQTRREPASPQPPAQQQQAQEELDPAIAELLAIFKAEGVTITEADPGFKEINTILADPNGDVHQMRKAAYHWTAEKRARLKTLQDNAAGRVVSGGQTQTTSAVSAQRARDYLEAAHRK